MHLPSGPEMIILLVIVLILFGGAKVPQLMKGLGEGMREFKKATRDDDDVRPSAPISSPSSSSNETRVQ